MTPSETTVPYGIPLDRETRFDPPAAIMALHRDAEMRRLRYHPNGRLGWLVTSHRLARAVLSDSRFCSRLGGPAQAPVAMSGLEAYADFEGDFPTTPGMFIEMDPPDHTRLRRKLTGVFTVRRMRVLEPRIEQFVDQRLDALAATGAPADLIEQFAMPVPAQMICELLGVPYEQRDRFESDTSAIFTLNSGDDAKEAAFGRLFGFISELARAKRSEPTDDLLSDLAADPELDESEIAGMGMLLLVAGHETTAKMIGLGTLALLENRDQWDLLREQSELMATAVEELLRYLTIIHTGIIRQVKTDFEFEGHPLTAGEYVTVSVQTANRDEAHFIDPDTLDVTRGAKGHLSFGHGVHQCLGQQLARIEMRIAFSRLIDRFPDLRLAVPADEVPMRTDQSFYGATELPVTWSDRGQD
ncbi:cytochrome P450 [Microlunatus soli]|uniref:Cytochrome P450 n=1 Tax=Microlunatus soli TaxID=630515 RepID=A0A1H1MSY2_9ACTN|nr:cytochrome P450 [Microlunatus soli]SDR89806.1 Cytochrome P450 [Microlunatus soli]